MLEFLQSGRIIQLESPLSSAWWQAHRNALQGIRPKEPAGDFWLGSWSRFTHFKLFLVVVALMRVFSNIKLTMSVYLFERVQLNAANLTVSPTFGRTSRTVFMLDWPFMVGGGLHSRGEPLGIQEL